MGAHQSTQSTAYCAPKADATTSTSSALEPGGNNDAPPPLMPQNATAPVVPAKPAAPMPQLMRQETFEEKLYRKVSVLLLFWNVWTCVSCYFICTNNIHIHTIIIFC